MKKNKNKNKTYTYFFVPSLNCREDGRDLPLGGMFTPIPAGVTNPSLLPQTPITLPPFPSGWLVGVVAKYKGSGRSLSPAGTEDGGQAVFPSLLYHIFYHPRAAVSPPPPLLISPSRGFVQRGRELRQGWRGPGREQEQVAGRGCRGFRTGRP